VHRIFSSWHVRLRKCRLKWTRQASSWKKKEYTATAGGAVTAVVTGKFEIKSLDIKKEAVDPEDVEVLSDMIIGAVNEALRKARDEKSETMDKISGGLNVPGLF